MTDLTERPICVLDRETAKSADDCRHCDGQYIRLPHPLLPGVPIHEPPEPASLWAPEDGSDPLEDAPRYGP